MDAVAQDLWVRETTQNLFLAVRWRTTALTMSAIFGLDLMEGSVSHPHWHRGRGSLRLFVSLAPIPGLLPCAFASFLRAYFDFCGWFETGDGKLDA